VDNRGAIKDEVGGDRTVFVRLDHQACADSIEIGFEKIPSFASVVVIAVATNAANDAGAGAGRKDGSGSMNPEGLEVKVDAQDVSGMDGVGSSQGEERKTRAGANVLHAWGGGGGRGGGRGGGNGDGGGEGDVFDSEPGELAEPDDPIPGLGALGDGCKYTSFLLIIDFRGCCGFFYCRYCYYGCCC